MDSINKPTKNQVRSYMELRQAERNIPPSIEEIRRQLGWTLVSARVNGSSLNVAQ